MTHVDLIEKLLTYNTLEKVSQEEFDDIKANMDKVGRSLTPPLSLSLSVSLSPTCPSPSCSHTRNVLFFTRTPTNSAQSEEERLPGTRGKYY